MIIGGSFLGTLGITFIVLKLCEVISWSWWLVLLPIYGPTMLFIVLFLTYIFCRILSEKDKK